MISIDSAGFFSFMTFSWMTPYIWQAYKRGLTLDDVPLGSQYDACDLNSQRYGDLNDLLVGRMYLCKYASTAI